MDVYIARQPIFTAAKEIYGYELLFRDSMANVFPDIDGGVATSRLLSNSFSTFDLERLCGGKRIFVNFTRDLLVKEVPRLFPQDRLVVEILEDVDPDQEVIHACQRIAQDGYSVALDDFFFKPDMLPLIQISKTIKIDFRQTPTKTIHAFIQRLAPFAVDFLAEKIETYEEFQLALAMGFTLFQGYFFCKPEILSGKDIAPNKLTLLQIIGEINRRECNLERLSAIINRDVSMTYKLLRYINSAFFRRRQEIQSIRHAVVMLGEKEIKKFVSVVATAALALDKPSELIRSSIIRARMCELLGTFECLTLDKFELFLVGLFSRIDAMLDSRMEDIITKLPLSPNVVRALTRGEGPLADLLQMVQFYEAGDWDHFSRTNQKLPINTDRFPEFYLEAIGWADNYTSL
jgi:EAL and modified HD-GYP domain-containing signal transduction protein